MAAKDFSQRTRTEYTHDLTELLAFLSKHSIITPQAVTLPHLEAYQAELDRRGLAVSSRRRKTFVIKTFFAFLERFGMITKNVALRLIPPPPQPREPRFLSEEEYQRLLRTCSHNARDAAIIELFLQTGMRLSELSRLTLSSIELPKRITKDLDNMGSVHVLRKGGKTQMIYLNYKACQALASYLKVRPKVDHEALFVTKFKTPMSGRSVQNVVTKYMKEAGITGASVHTLRHTMATHHAAKGTDLKVLQETLGHASLSTTSLYVSLAKKAQRQALQEHAL
jgi:site-specific recombinase XerD